jgi:hypothetical protein
MCLLLASEQVNDACLLPKCKTSPEQALEALQLQKVPVFLANQNVSIFQAENDHDNDNEDDSY